MIVVLRWVETTNQLSGYMRMLGIYFDSFELYVGWF